MKHRLCSNIQWEQKVVTSDWNLPTCKNSYTFYVTKNNHAATPCTAVAILRIQCGPPRRGRVRQWGDRPLRQAGPITGSLTTTYRPSRFRFINSSFLPSSYLLLHCSSPLVVSYCVLSCNITSLYFIFPASFFTSFVLSSFPQLYLEDTIHKTYLWTSEYKSNNSCLHVQQDTDSNFGHTY